MSGKERREQILTCLQKEKEPLNGSQLAEKLGVSRQVIVQDIAILRANGSPILSAHKGYILQEDNRASRVFKVHHTDEQVEEELNLFVDLGGRVEDVFVYHKVYGIIRADMNMKSRRNVQKYMEDISAGVSTQLKNLTSNYHYHTITAEEEQTLDLIQEALLEKGFLAKLQDYEPVDFWKKTQE